MANPIPTNTLPSGASAALSKTGAFDTPWYRFFSSLIGPAPSASVLTASGSPFTFTASQRGNLLIKGGTISAVALIRGRVSIAFPTSAYLIPMSQGDGASVTYTGSPAFTYIPS